MKAKQLYQLLIKEANIFFQERNRVFEIDENNDWFFWLICCYFSQDVNFKKFEQIKNQTGGELNKWLFIYGSVGTGKSTTFKILQETAKKYNLFKLYWFISIRTNQVVSDYNINGDISLQKWLKGNVYFDDLGTERVASHFGKEDIFARILEERYNLFIDKRKKTFITSNLTLLEVKKRYGDRVHDRFFEMFNIIELTGESRRF